MPPTPARHLFSGCLAPKLKVFNPGMEIDMTISVLGIDIVKKHVSTSRHRLCWKLYLSIGVEN